MSDTYTISKVFTRFIDIISSLTTPGRDIPNFELVKKILRYFPKSWEPKMTVILEVKDLIMLNLEQLFGPLTTNEVITSTDNKKKKKDGAIKV